MTPVLLQPAFVLHRRPYRETSCLVELWTPDYGRLSGIMRGVRKPRSAINGLLQPFVPLMISWTGKGELKTLTHIETNGHVTILHGDCLYAGFYLNELLMHLLAKWDAHPKLYDAYQHTILTLGSEALLEEKTLRSFEKCLLDELGYGLLPKRNGFLNNIFLNNIEADQYYRFVPGEGLVICAKADRHDIFHGRHLLAMAKEEWTNEACLRDAKRLIRCVLSFLLEGKPIQSRRLFMKIEREETA
jgi:DNA repair protein RecO (recombination protein O)